MVYPCCHGANGTAIVIDGVYMGDFMRSSPHEFQHKARFGDPMVVAMGPFSDNTESIVNDLLKAGQDTIAFPGF